VLAFDFVQSILIARAAPLLRPRCGVILLRCSDQLTVIPLQYRATPPDPKAVSSPGLPPGRQTRVAKIRSPAPGERAGLTGRCSTDFGLRTTLQKKRGVAHRYASLLWGTAEGTAGLGDTLFALGRRRVFLLWLGLDRVLFTQPASQIDQPAARTAKWEAGPFVGHGSCHLPVANWATYANHRKLRSYPSRNSWRVCQW
jgi:hypothetical protein